MAIICALLCLTLQVKTYTYLFSILHNSHLIFDCKHVVRKFVVVVVVILDAELLSKFPQN